MRRHAFAKLCPFPAQGVRQSTPAFSDNLKALHTPPHVLYFVQQYPGVLAVALGMGLRAQTGHHAAQLAY